MRPHFEMHQRGFQETGTLLPALTFLFFLTIIIVLIVVIVWYAHSRTSTSIPVGTDPLEIAKLRFAKGEITKTELNEIRKELKAD